IRWEHQETITRWAWDQFSQQLSGVRIAKKTVDRLRQLIWLAAQDAKAGLAGRDQYQYGDLAAMVDVEVKNWSKTFTTHWEAMLAVFSQLDRDALLSLTKTRSEQKSTFSQQSIAKVD
ncbi:TPA: bacteriophage antitermination protein Q, partial [Raoultella ornithinolytica]